MKNRIALFVLCVSAAIAVADDYEPRLNIRMVNAPLEFLLSDYAEKSGKTVERVEGVDLTVTIESDTGLTKKDYLRFIEEKLAEVNVGLYPIASNRLVAAWIDLSKAQDTGGSASEPNGPGVGQGDEVGGSTVLEKDLQEHQMQLIRDCVPTEPIPLTKEMDEQLVRQGVLPPMDDPGDNGKE